jgi:hypothetical protein
MNARKTCGKRRFADEYEAGKRLRSAQRRAERNGYTSPLRFYYHADCEGFHLTSKPDRDESGVTTWVIPGTEDSGQEDPEHHQPYRADPGRIDVDATACR